MVGDMTQRTVLLAQLARLENLLETVRIELGPLEDRHAHHATLALKQAIELLNTIADGV